MLSEFYDGYGDSGRHHRRPPIPQPRRPVHNPPPAAQAPPPPPTPPKRSRWPYVGAGAAACVFLAFGVLTGGVPGSSIPEAINQPPVSAAPVADPGGLDDDDPSTTGFDQRFTWASGIGLEVTAPQPYQTGQYAYGAENDREISVDTTIFNGSDHDFDYNPAIMGPTATHDGDAAGRVIDTENGVGVSPRTTIRPGGSFTFTAVFSIGAKRGELVLAYREVFAGSPALFVGIV